MNIIPNHLRACRLEEMAQSLPRTCADDHGDRYSAGKGEIEMTDTSLENVQSYSAIASSVKPSSRGYLTAGKEYKVLFNDGVFFKIVDDDDDTLYCRWDDCAHLGGGIWRKIKSIEKQESAAALSADLIELLDALADLLTYLEDGIGDHDSEEGKQARALIAKHRGGK